MKFRKTSKSFSGRFVKAEPIPAAELRNRMVLSNTAGEVLPREEKNKVDAAVNRVISEYGAVLLRLSHA